MKERVIFLGGKNVGHGVLDHLTKTDNVVAVFSNPSDRKKDSWYKSVEPLAKKHGSFYTTENINKMPDFVKAQSPDYIVSAYYDTVVSKDVLDTVKNSINVHLGLSEEYLGCYPITFAILDGKTQAGITIHKMTVEIDAGDVYAQGIFPLDNTDTGRTAYNKATEEAIEVFKLTWEKIKSGKLEAHPKKGGGIYHTRDSFPSHEIDLGWDNERIDRHIRALTFPPFPKPYFVVGGNRYEINYDRNNNKNTTT